MDFEGKVVLVTGGKRGLGRSITDYFAERMAAVAVVSRNCNESLDLKHEVSGVTCFEADVCCPNSAADVVSRVVDHFGRLDVLICNVGSGQSVPPGEECFEDLMDSLKVNFFSATNTIQAALQHLEESLGSIVCISSICGRERVPNAPATYSAAKAALDSYVRSVSEPLGKKGVRINAVAPGNLMFEGSVWDKRWRENQNETSEMLFSEVPLGCFGQPEKIARIVGFLCGQDSEFVTGSIWVADGGQSRG